MATPEVTTRPSPAQDSPFSTATNNREALPCGYCQRPIAKRILAARKSYCGKLCAALGLIADVNLQDGIDDSFGTMDVLIESVLYEGRLKYPVKVRYSDAEKFIYSADEDAVDGDAVIVVIDDDGTPDWTPDPVFDADQDDIDGAVERLLTQVPMRGEEARS